VTRHHFKKIEFYITNVCNLNCKRCNRFNDFNFKGWQRWSDYQDIYQRWSEYIDIDDIVILGGEPLLNPTINEWIVGLRETFKTARSIQILTNGTQLNKVKNLYQTIQKTDNAWLGISCHNTNALNELDKEIRSFLQGNILRVERGHELNRYNADFFYIDHNLQIPVWIQDSFYPSSIVPSDRGTLTLHNSDVNEAHRLCGFVQYKNYHFIHGKLYKCGPVALFPEFDQQHNLDISEEDRLLLNAYRPLTVSDYPELGAKFIEQIDQPIAQCKFCPSKKNNLQIFATSKNSQKLL
jgi:organic radical activating enzyme